MQVPIVSLPAVLALSMLAPSASSGPQTPAPRGEYRAWLEVPGGELPFGLVLEGQEPVRAHVTNGEERLPIPAVRVDGAALTLAFPHYDSTIVATIAADGSLAGEWTKQRGGDRTTRLPFRATLSPTQRTRAARFPARGASTRPAPIGRYAVDFESDEDPAVGLFEVDATGTARGTFLTTLGDYRYLAGSWHGDVLELSCFDGAHAFLFRARAAEDGTLAGDFWSSGSWHETWTARPDPTAALPDPFEQVRWTGQRSVDELAFPDADRASADPRALSEWSGHPRVLQVFGTWCPNCCDETRLLAELDERYRDRGLRIVGIAFEHTGDLERDRRQVTRWRERFGARYPVLLGGTSDKKRAAEALGALDRVKSFPTTVFVDRDGQVRAVHSGFAGPATGARHERLRERFEALILELLAD